MTALRFFSFSFLMSLFPSYVCDAARCGSGFFVRPPAFSRLFPSAFALTFTTCHDLSYFAAVDIDAASALSLVDAICLSTCLSV